MICLEMEGIVVKKIVVQSENVGNRIDVFLTSELSESRNFISKNIKNGNIKVNGEVKKGGYILKENDVIEVND